PSSLTPCPSFPHLPSFFFFFFNDTATTAIYTLSLHVALPIWPPSAGLIVITAQRGGSFRESIAMAKSYVEARQDHGASELLDEIDRKSTRLNSRHFVISYAVFYLKKITTSIVSVIRPPCYLYH